MEQVLLLVNAFPATNDSTVLDQPSTSSDVDIPALLTSIRAKYRAACASLGIRARMVAGASGGAGGEEGVRAVGMSL